MYSEKQLCKAVAVEGCLFDNCRQPVKFENSTRGPLPFDSQTTYNLWIKGCTFRITGQVAPDNTYDVTPTAIWVEAEGDYNLFVQDCLIQATGLDDLTRNFRHGIVVDTFDADTDVHLALENVTVGDGQGQGVKECGIFLRTTNEGELVTQLDPARYPNVGASGFTNLNLHHGLHGAGVFLDCASSGPQVDVRLFDSEIYDQAEGAGVRLQVHEGSDAYARVDSCTIHDNGAGGLFAEVCTGALDLEVTGCDIHDTAPAQSQGYAGIGLRTATPAGASEASLLTATLKNNRVHDLEGTGITVQAEDLFLFSNLLKVTSSNDRVYGNLAHGVYLDGPPGNAPGFIRAELLYLTACDNTGMGITFDDAGRHEVNVVNSIFWGNGLDDVDTAFAGSISYSDWKKGLDGGGSGHGYNCINDDPRFVPDSLYHIQWDPNDPNKKSPCVDKGDNSAVRTVPLDMEGDNRKIDGDGNGSTITDMGADEFDPSGQGGGAP